jgi:hypothetical protein
MLMVELYIAYRMSYIVCEKHEKSGIRMRVRKSPYLFVGEELQDRVGAGVFENLNFGKLISFEPQFLCA